MASSSKGENGAGDVLPTSLDQLTKLTHKLVNIVVEALVCAVDVSKPTVPACPLAIADPTLDEAHHPNVIGIQAVAGYYPCPPFEAVSGRPQGDVG